jgi:hypothetical protein
MGAQAIDIVLLEALIAARRSEPIRRVLCEVTIAGILHITTHAFPELMLHKTVTPATIMSMSQLMDPSL